MNSIVSLGDRSVPNSVLFQMFDDILTRRRERLFFNYGGEDRDRELEWNDDIIINPRARTWISPIRTNGCEKAIRLTELTGLVGPRLERRTFEVVSLDLVAAYGDNEPEFECAVYVERFRELAPAYQVGKTDYATTEFLGLKPEEGRVVDPRDWLNRIVDEYLVSLPIAESATTN